MVEGTAGEFYFAGLEHRIASSLVRSESEQVRAKLAGLREMVDRCGEEVAPEDAAPLASSLLEAILTSTRHHYLERSKSVLAASEKEAVERARGTAKALEAFRGKVEDQVSPAFLESIDTEAARLDTWVEDVKSWGTATSRKNFDYNAAGNYVTNILNWADVPYAAVEAVAVLWHAGYSELEGQIDVLSPFKRYKRQPGKDDRDAPRREAEQRWNSHEERIAKHLRGTLEKLPDSDPRKQGMIARTEQALRLVGMPRGQRMNDTDT